MKDTASTTYGGSGTLTFDFADRVAIVTGASRGIGAHISQALSLAGARLVIHGRDAAALDQRVAALRGMGGEAVAVQGDIREPETSTRLTAAAINSFGRLDVLVNNAGGNFSAPLESLSSNGWKALIETNLSSVFHASTACRQIFAFQGGGAIVNIGSVAGDHAHPHRAAYAAAKAGVVSLTKTMAWEWAPANIRVNCVAPGAIKTEASRFADEDVESSTTRFIPLGRLGHPSDVADACLFLCSDAASFITGEVLRVDGGPLTAMPADSLDLTTTTEGTDHAP